MPTVVRGDGQGVTEVAVGAMNSLPVQRVRVEYTASVSEIEAIAAVFSRHGLAVEPEAVKGQRYGSVLPWLIEITLAAPFAAFFTSAASEAGKDAYQAAKALLRDLARTRRKGSDHGSIDLIDSTSSHLILPAPIPEEALKALEQLDWTLIRSAYLLWDDEYGRWYEIDGEPKDLD